MNETFNGAAIQAELRTRWLGRHMAFFDTVGSTNDEAKRMAAAGAAEGTVVVAEAQTAGRGRLQRRWVAPAGSALLFSLVLRPALAASRVQQVTMACGLAAADAAAEVAGVAVGLKWPNDLLWEGRKIAGILTEMATLGDQIDYVVVGIGINVNVPAAFWAGEHDDVAAAREADPSVGGLAGQAASVAEAAGRPVSRLQLLCRLLEGVEARYEALRAGVSPHEEWGRRMSILGREVVVRLGDATLAGRAVGVDSDGALLVEQADGRRVRVLAGDVTLRRPPA